MNTADTNNIIEQSFTSVIDLPKEPIDNPEFKIFICEGNQITEYNLEGMKKIGRSQPEDNPDIPLHNSYVSRNHGYFWADSEMATYTAEETTNGILYNGSLLSAGERVILKDGDELSIPTWNGEKRTDIRIACAFSHSRISFWKEMQQAGRDALTNLPGREGFINWWHKNYHTEDFSNSCFFILDVDDFKSFNDNMGHATGDAVLKFLSDKMRRLVRSDLQLCRWGGDEFVGVIPGTPSQVEKRLSSLLKTTLKIEDKEPFSIFTSIGIADTNAADDRTNVKDLIALADKALYLSKNNGKGKICIYK